MENKNIPSFPWAQLFAYVGILVAILGFIVPLYIHSDNKLMAAMQKFDQRMEEGRKETNAILEGIRKDMSDFHSRLAVQDMEFKMRMCAIEEKK